MAHWIVDDHGFGGTYYRCSECRESWCDIYSNVSTSYENCPNCGVAMNEDETEYIEKKKTPRLSFSSGLVMTAQEIISCRDCIHCFKSRRSKTGYACEVWGYDDFASPTILDGFCHRAKKKPDIKETKCENDHHS